jgi:thiol-disulfide isomerase/thioredoxin
MENLGSLLEIKDILENNQRSMVMFSAKWCGACIKMKPKIESLREIYKNVNFSYVDITTFEDEDEVINKYAVNKLPSFVLFNNTEEVFRIRGSKDKKTILENLEILNIVEEELET